MIGGDQADSDKAKDKIDCYSKNEVFQAVRQF